MSNPQPKNPVLLLRSTSRNFPLDLVPELERAGHPLHAVESIEDFIASPLRARPFLAVLEIGHLADLDRALIVFDWTEQMQPLAPARYLLLLSSKNITLGEKAMRFGSAEVATLPQPARNLLFKLELQSRLLTSQDAAKRTRARGFSTELGEGAGKRRILVARGQDEKAGQWRMGESSPQGKIRWRWIRNPERETPGEKEEFHWLAESQEAPRFDKKLDAWVIEGDAPNLLCFRGEAQIFRAVPPPQQTPAPAESEAPPTAKISSPPGEKPAAAAVVKGAGEKAARENPFAPHPGAPEEKKEPRAEVTRIAADPPAPAYGTGRAAATPGKKTAAPSLARLFEAMKAKTAGEKTLKGGEAEEEAAQRAEGETDPPKGGTLSQASHLPEQPTAPAARVEAEGRSGGVELPELRLAAEKDAAAPAPDFSAPAAKPSGDPEEFSRAASVGSLTGPGSQGTTPSPQKQETEAQVHRGGSSSVPFHSIPSRSENAPSAPPVQRIAGEPAPHTGTPPLSSGMPGQPPPADPEAEPSGKISPSTDTVAPGSQPAAPEEKTDRPANTPPSPAGPPATTLPGGIFDSQLPPLGARPQAKLTGGPETKTPPGAAHAPPETEPATSPRGTHPPLLEPEHRIRPPLSPGEGPAPSSVKGSAPADEDTLVKKSPAAEGTDESRSFLRDRHYLLMTLRELADKDSSWHPVGRYRIYLSARHRYYGLPHPGDVLPLWIYEGELAPEFIDEQKSWKFYDRLPVAVFSLETMPHEVLEYLYKMAGKELPKGEGSAVVTFAGGRAESGLANTEVTGQNPDHYLAEEKKKRSAWGAVADFLKALFGGKRD